MVKRIILISTLILVFYFIKEEMLPSFNILINNLDDSNPETFKAFKNGFNIYLSILFVFLLSVYLYLFNIYLKRKKTRFFLFLISFSFVVCIAVIFQAALLF